MPQAQVVCVQFSERHSALPKSLKFSIKFVLSAMCSRPFDACALWNFTTIPWCSRWEIKKKLYICVSAISRRYSIFHLAYVCMCVRVSVCESYCISFIVTRDGVVCCIFFLKQSFYTQLFSLNSLSHHKQGSNWRHVTSLLLHVNCVSS